MECIYRVTNTLDGAVTSSIVELTEWAVLGSNQ